MKKRLLIYLAFVSSVLLNQSCNSSCKLNVGPIQYDEAKALLTGDEIPLSVSIENQEACFVEYFWSTSAGSINPPNGSTTPVLQTDCQIKNYTIQLDVKNEKGKTIYSRSLAINTKNLAPLQVLDDYVYSGFFGDINRVKVERTSYQGKESDRFNYNPNGPEGYAGVYYQYPPNNWGDQPGKNLSGYNKVKFLVCSPDGAAINFIVGGVADNTKEHKDSFKGVTGFKILTTEWEEMEIDLRNRDLSSVIGGFAWVANREYNSSPVSFYIADIRYERENCE